MVLCQDGWKAGRSYRSTKAYRRFADGIVTRVAHPVTARDRNDSEQEERSEQGHEEGARPVNTQGRFPFRFFVVVFAWSWLTWLPLVLGYHGIGPLGRDTAVALTVPLTLLVAAFGPAVAAVYTSWR
jgi:hypothetical protein